MIINKNKEIKLNVRLNSDIIEYKNKKIVSKNNINNNGIKFIKNKISLVK